MSNWIRNIVVGFTFALAGTLPASAQLGGKPGKPMVKVRLIASVEAIVPGQSFDIGLQFQLEEGWHIYWKNSGDSGMPPKVAWNLPEGFSVGEIQFPVPKREVAPGNIVTNILGGEPILLATVTPPTSLGGRELTLRADLKFLICNKTCIRASSEVELTLPTTEPGSKPVPVNENLFRRAKRALPKTTSKYVTVSVTPSPSRPAPGSKFELALNVRIKPGYHLQSNEPLNPSFVATRVFLERADGLFFDQPVFPHPKFRTIKYVGKVSEFVGSISIRVSGEVDKSSPGVPDRIGGLLRYQACNEKGTCFPPEAVSFDVNFGKAGGTAIGAAVGENGTAPAATTADTVAEESTAPPLAVQGSAADEEAGWAAWLESKLQAWGLPGMLIGCFLYGMLINATPCVLPLLSIKVLGFVQQAHESRRRTLVLGLSFGVGVMIFFVLLGLLASQGKNILQFPAAVIALGTVVMALALSMLGVFTLQVPTSATKLDAAIQKEGPVASFGKGMLAPVLGFACTAPLMAGAFAWATRQPANLAILAFVFMGFGMAFPYIFLGAFPKLLNFLPRPGNWMITFERIMGFLLLGFVVLLIHPMVAHAGVEGLEWTLVFLVTVGMACWLLGQIQITMPVAQRWRYRGGAGAIVLGSAVLIYGWIFPLTDAKAGSGTAHGNSLIAWREWSPDAVEKAVRSGTTVFVDFTGAYCTNCKVNKAIAINTRETAEKMKQLGVVAFQGDFTTGDERIRDELMRYGAAALPLNLIFPADKYEHPIVLKKVLSKQYLLAKLDEAGPSRNASVAGTLP